VSGAAGATEPRTPPGRTPWRLAAVRDVHPETPSAVTIVLDVPGWPGHRAGQHVDVRLTAEDGYQTQRSYSIASAPEEPRVALTVERLDDGEVSPYLAGELRAGDELELRGPVGGWFTWTVDDGGPLLLVAGGSGLVPLMAMLRHRRLAGGDAEARLLVSAPSSGELVYRDELEAAGAETGVDVSLTFTRAAPAGWTGFARRVDEAMLTEAGWPPERRPHAFVCGPTGFVEAVADGLLALGHAPERIRTERFGATGG
jgi:ferredoxin-NADP reductase